MSQRFTLKVDAVGEPTLEMRAHKSTCDLAGVSACPFLNIGKNIAEKDLTLVSERPLFVGNGHLQDLRLIGYHIKNKFQQRFIKKNFPEGRASQTAELFDRTKSPAPTERDLDVIFQHDAGLVQLQSLTHQALPFQGTADIQTFQGSVDQVGTLQFIGGPDPFGTWQKNNFYGLHSSQNQIDTRIPWTTRFKRLLKESQTFHAIEVSKSAVILQQSFLRLISINGFSEDFCDFPEEIHVLIRSSNDKRNLLENDLSSLKILPTESTLQLNKIQPSMKVEENIDAVYKREALKQINCNSPINQKSLVDSHPSTMSECNDGLSTSSSSKGITNRAPSKFTSPTHTAPLDLDNGLMKYNVSFRRLVQDEEHDKQNSNISVQNFGLSSEMMLSSYKQPTITSKTLSSLQALLPSQHSRVPLEAHLDHLTLDNLLLVKQIGSGQFGIVYLVTDLARKRFFALKCLSKSLIEERRVQNHLRSEKRVMEMTDFPFIAKFYKSFKDSSNVYFLLEYIDGIEMFDVIREIGLLNSEQCRFYIASLVLSLEYLHSNHIIYRDLKPQNIMVDRSGYVKLVDMGACKMVLNCPDHRTFTIIGTPHYMAPEILQGKGYTVKVDLWSLGICMFEFMCGYLPFGEDIDDPYEIYHEITKIEIQFPNEFPDLLAKSLICQLLRRSPQERLLSNISEIRSHIWFQDFQWTNLLQKTHEGIYKYQMETRQSVENVLRKARDLPSITKFMSKTTTSHTRKSSKRPLINDWDSIF